MSQPHSDETLHDFLNRRERDLARQIADLRALVVPLEAELTQIRRAKLALGVASTTSLADTAGQVDDSARRALESALRRSSPKGMTIKELILRALVEHFPQGASPSEIGQRIETEYGRRIDASSIRPNLSRLREEQLVVHDGLASRWIFNPAATGTLLLLFDKPEQEEEDSELLEMAKKFAWKETDDSACQDQDVAWSALRVAAKSDCK